MPFEVIILPWLCREVKKIDVSSKFTLNKYET